jgi:putative PIN family toxin of toxin-antitoxin system
VRIVLDTNVIVSGLLSESGPPAQILDLCIAGDVQMAVDARIVAEYETVLARAEFGFDPSDVQHFLSVLNHAEHVVGVPIPLTFPDAGDLPFIEVAVAAAVDAIVTGNVRHFRAAEGKLAIDVVTPRRFLALFARR